MFEHNPLSILAYKHVKVVQHMVLLLFRIILYYLIEIIIDVYSVHDVGKFLDFDYC